MKLIDKDTLVAEIENRIEELQNLHKENERKLDSIQKTAILLCIDECKVILSFIGTLEVKEVDLTKEIKNVQHKYKTIDEYENYPCTMYANSIEWIAKHFFELGLQAQKGEEV